MSIRRHRALAVGAMISALALLTGCAGGSSDDATASAAPSATTSTAPSTPTALPSPLPEPTSTPGQEDTVGDGDPLTVG